MRKKWILYDDRAISEGPERALVLTISNTLNEARQDKREMGYGVIFEYEFDEGEEPNLINGRLIE